MWIRSQSKYTLINTNVIRICDDCGDYLICGYSDGYAHELGVYSTFEKALEVLNNIQTQMDCTLKETLQMPRDEDVKV